MTPDRRPPIRVTAVWTHPIQYLAPWFRWITGSCDEIELTVLYVVEPDSSQQAAGFGTAFQWDVPLREGYESQVLRPAQSSDDIRSQRFLGLDAPDIGKAIVATRPDVVLLPGWYSLALVRALRACKNAKIPVLYRGDSTLRSRASGWRGALGGLRARYLARKFDAALSVGTRSDAYLLHLGVHPQRIVRAPHCIDVDRFAREADEARGERRALRRSLGLPEDAYVVLFAGKCEAIKRPLDAVRGVARLGTDAVLAVAGDGPALDDMRSEAQRLGVRLATLGFRNQSEMPRVYAAADCVVLPSQSETWGLVVNEALACGVPCVVSHTVGCAPDLIGPDNGAVFRMGDVDGLASALASVRCHPADTLRTSCRHRAQDGSFAAATAGLVQAARAALHPTRAPRRTPRILALCGGMVRIYGLEQQTFAVLGVARHEGWPVHCMMNEWENHRIVPLAEGIGATWSTSRYRARLDKRIWNPRVLASQGVDYLANCGALLRAARRFRPTHIMAPEMGAIVRHVPALQLLRRQGTRAILRAGNVPERSPLHERVWRVGVAPAVDRIVANSRFGRARLLEAGVPAAKVGVIHNAVRPSTDPDVSDDLRDFLAHDRVLLCVGQVAPFKGTHLAVDAALALRQAGHDVRLLVVGHMPTWPPAYVTYAEQLRDAVSQANAQDHIRFAGQRPEVLALMRRAWLLVAPIVQEETFGNVALEARWNGLPVVATNRGGLPELVDHERSGFLCADATVSDIVAGIRWFLDDPARRAAAHEASLSFFQEPEGQAYLPASFAKAWRAQFDDR